MSDDSLISVTTVSGLDTLQKNAELTCRNLDGGGYGGALGALRYASILERQASNALLAAVLLARSEGMTWRHIGQMIGTTPQAAHARFAKLIHP